MGVAFGTSKNWYDTNDQIGKYSGLYGKKVSGYFNDDVTYFNSATLLTEDENVLSINFSTAIEDYFSWMWIGYFKAPIAGTYGFKTTSDDSSLVWIGSNAISGFTVGNSLVNNSGLHADFTVYSTINLNAGYTPIRIMFGENNGVETMRFYFSGPSISETTDGTGYLFGGNYAKNNW